MRSAPWLRVHNGVTGKRGQDSSVLRRMTDTYLLTYSVVQNPSWEANWFAASQENPRISRNPKVHYRTHKRPPPVSILGQPNPIHMPTSSHLLTYSMVQIPSWEANWFAASQEIPRILRNPKVHYRTHKRPPPVCILGQPNPVHIPT